MASASCLISLLLVLAMSSAVSAQLSSTFYDTSCPRALATIKSAVNAAVAQEARMGASLLRLHFHDCFVQGCDASVLLAGNEQNAGPNQSLRGFNVIDNIKAQLEAICKQTVSCADILAVAARDSVVALGGPSWTVLLGRRDSTTAASSATVSSSLLPPSSSLAQLISGYGNLGLNPTDMVALSGAHTIGQAHCPSYRAHIYNDTNINQAFATSLQASCPAGSGGATVLAPLDTTTPTRFDNAYYQNLLAQKGLLHSDQELFNGGSTDATVRSFASSASAFGSAFATAVVKMGNISPKTGSQGQIRTTCSKGCDASILLAGNEQNDPPNLTLRGFNVIANIKAQVEAICKQTVSCADILAVAARDSVVALGGPSWTVPLGRRDSPKAAPTSLVTQNLLPPTSSLAELIKGYGNVGLSPTDMVALSGAHTIGQAHCPSYQDHIYNDTNINQAFATSLKASCPATGGANVMAPLDTTTPTRFDNAYYTNLLSQKGLLHSDQQLFNGGSTDNTVRNFASNPAAFSSAFATAMVNMGNISPLTGTQGQIRTTCSAANS